MIGTLQGLRAVFVLLVFLSHVGWNSGWRFDFGGDCGVSFFFALSGFVLSASRARRMGLKAPMESHAGFMGRHMARIYPIHLLTLLAALALDAFQGHPREWAKVALNALLLQSWVPDTAFNFSLNAVAWFLSDIAFLYLAFPALFAMVTGSSRRALAASGAIVLLAYTILAGAVPDGSVTSMLYVSPVARTLDFALGIAAFRLFASPATNGCMAWWAARGMASRTLAEALPLALFALCLAAYPLVGERMRCAPLFWVATPLAIYVFAVADARRGWISRFLGLPWMRWLGDHSLEMFMTHVLVLRVVGAVAGRLGHGSGDMPAVAAALAVTIAVSWAARKYFTLKIYALLRKSR